MSLAVAVIAMVGVEIFATREPQRDPVTGCPVGALPLAHTVIIVDQSARYSPRQIYYAQSVILLEYDRLLPGERLTVVGLSPNPDFPQRILSKCRLRRGSDVVGFVTNPMMVEETFNRVVGHELSSFTRELATTETAPRSPIMETITAMLDSIDFSAGVPNRRLVLISAAEVDGATGWQKFWKKISFPLLTPYIFYNLVVGMIGALPLLRRRAARTDFGGDHA